VYIFKERRFGEVISKREVNSNELIERVKHFSKLIFSVSSTSPTIAEALRRLPCQWMRIIGT
ncbi:hypothetical protein AB4520_14535, partial [Vibrio renipiscarius]|uniref:hypothetical protein n=1 Tax=Vibrio renipiscarius TaxID=1461322 RepID=UPI00354F965B